MEEIMIWISDMLMSRLGYSKPEIVQSLITIAKKVASPTELVNTLVDFGLSSSSSETNDFARQIFVRVGRDGAVAESQANYLDENCGLINYSPKEDNSGNDSRKRIMPQEEGEQDDQGKKIARRRTCRDVISGDGSEYEDQREEEFLTHGAKTASEKGFEDDRKKLPVYTHRESLLQLVHDNQVVVIIGETGSGKSTQIPQYLHEAGYTNHGKIGCTQPHRVAVMSAAARVAQEMGVHLGEEVGYSVRFEDLTSDKTILKQMTDEMLLQELLLEPDLASYSVVMVDEAHERSLSTDVLFSLVKDIARSRPDFKVLISSATSTDAALFSAYFHAAPIFRIPGLLYLPPDIRYRIEPLANDYLDVVIDFVSAIHFLHPEGDILVFLLWYKDIAIAEVKLKHLARSFGSGKYPLIICPIYADLTVEQQAQIFNPAPPGTRKVILATNVAETSLPIDGIAYVIDPGFRETKFYNPQTGMDSLRITPVSRASATQRAHRISLRQRHYGRCYRLYTENVYAFGMHENYGPETQRSNLANVVLTLKCIGVQDFSNFDFMDRPSDETLLKALELLYALGALDNQGELTEVGRKMAEFPLDPMFSRMIVASNKYKCTSEIITIIAMLSIREPVYYRPDNKQVDADIARERFYAGNVGDHIGLLNVYNSWKETNFSTQWCVENYVQIRSMERARSVRDQLESSLKRAEIEVTSEKNDLDVIKKVILSGFFLQLARLHNNVSYQTVKSPQTVHIHLSSSLAKVLPRWVVYHELLECSGSKKCMRQVTELKPEWLEEITPHDY